MLPCKASCFLSAIHEMTFGWCMFYNFTHFLTSPLSVCRSLLKFSESLDGSQTYSFPRFVEDVDVLEAVAAWPIRSWSRDLLFYSSFTLLMDLSMAWKGIVRLSNVLTLFVFVATKFAFVPAKQHLYRRVCGRSLMLVGELEVCSSVSLKWLGLNCLNSFYPSDGACHVDYSWGSSTSFSKSVGLTSFAHFYVFSLLISSLEGLSRSIAEFW